MDATRTNIHAATLRLTSNKLPRCRLVVGQGLVADMVNPPSFSNFSRRAIPIASRPPAAESTPNPKTCPVLLPPKENPAGEGGVRKFGVGRGDGLSSTGLAPVGRSKSPTLRQNSGIDQGFTLLGRSRILNPLSNNVLEAGLSRLKGVAEGFCVGCHVHSVS